LLEHLSPLSIFLLGAVATAAPLAWLHRRTVRRLEAWAVRALAEGRITKREVVEVYRALGRELEAAD